MGPYFSTDISISGNLPDYKNSNTEIKISRGVNLT